MVAASLLAAAICLEHAPIEAQNGVAANPLPVVFTNEALLRYDQSYSDLGDYFDQHLSEAGCIALVTRGGRQFEKTYRSYVEKVNAELVSSLGGATLKPLTCAAYSSYRNRTGAGGSSYAASLQLIEDELDQQRPLALNGQVELRLLTGASARAAGIIYDQGYPVLFLGEDFVREGRTGYLVHLLANLTGLKPIWGSGGPCGDDGMEDTPYHSGPNYDCLQHHRSTCGPNWELDRNVMDARDCDGQVVWTPNQAAYVLPKLELSLHAEPCGEAGRQLGEGRTTCKFHVTPNPISTETGCELVVAWSSPPAGRTLTLTVARGGVVVKSAAVEVLEGETSMSAISVCDLSPGAYTVTVRDAAVVCAELFIVGSSN